MIHWIVIYTMALFAVGYIYNSHNDGWYIGLWVVIIFIGLLREVNLYLNRLESKAGSTPDR